MSSFCALGRKEGRVQGTRSLKGGRGDYLKGSQKPADWCIWESVIHVFEGVWELSSPPTGHYMTWQLHWIIRLTALACTSCVHAYPLLLHPNGCSFFSKLPCISLSFSSPLPPSLPPLPPLFPPLSPSLPFLPFSFPLLPY